MSRSFKTRGATGGDTRAMTEISERYARNARRFLDKVAAVPADRWDAPTPCEEWTARDLVQHVVDAQGLFLGFVGREQVDLPSCQEDPLAAATGAFEQVQADLDDPEAANATFEGMFGTQTFAEGVDRFLSFDLVVHGWDLARATGQDEAIVPDELDRIEAAAAVMGQSDAMRGPGAFGPEVEAPEDADQQTRLLAFLGRSA
jgi:uncharacterized protein (TIGR03086 family)